MKKAELPEVAEVYAAAVKWYMTGEDYMTHGFRAHDYRKHSAAYRRLQIACMKATGRESFGYDVWGRTKKNAKRA